MVGSDADRCEIKLLCGVGSVVEHLHVRADMSLGEVCRMEAIILVSGDPPVSRSFTNEREANESR